MAKHRIGLTDLNVRPINSGTYRNRKKTSQLKKTETHMLSMKTIVHSQSKWTSLIVLVPKEDGLLRFRIEYGKLSAVNVNEAYPILPTDECVDYVGEVHIFLSLDANYGYL